MKLHYDEKHIEDFQCGEQKPIMEIMKLSKGKKIEVCPELNQIIFVSSGTVTFFNEKVSHKNIETGESVLIPMNSPCVVSAPQGATVLMVKLDENSHFYDYLPPDLSSKRKEKRYKKNENTGFLKSHHRMIEFAATFENYAKDGITDTRFFDLKLQEFLLLIQRYYPKYQTINFFIPIYTTDFIFASEIYKNFEQVRTIQELAEKLNYSLSGLEKKFNKVFGVSPYQWLQEQKAKRTYHEVCYTPKTFTNIAKEYGFSSPAHFNEFCKHYFGSTPGKLRKRMKATE